MAIYELIRNVTESLEHAQSALSPVAGNEQIVSEYSTVLGDDNLTIVRDFEIWSTSIRSCISSFFSINWLGNISYFPNIVPKIQSSVLNEDFVFNNHIQASFTFFEATSTSTKGFKKLLLGFFNSFFWSLPLSCGHLLTIRRLLMYGVLPASFSALGTVFGQLLFAVCILFGLRTIIITWFSLPLLSFLIIILLSFFIVLEVLAPVYSNWAKVKTKPMLTKYFIFNFLLSWVDQTTGFRYLSNLTLTPEPNILEAVASNTEMDTLILTSYYVLGLFFGSVFFTGLFGFIIFRLKNYLYNYHYLNSFGVWMQKTHSFSKKVVLVSVFISSPFAHSGADYFLSGAMGTSYNDSAMINSIMAPNRVKYDEQFVNLTAGFVNNSWGVNPCPFDEEMNDRPWYNGASFELNNIYTVRESVWVYEHRFQAFLRQHFRSVRLNKMFKRALRKQKKPLNELFKIYYRDRKLLKQKNKIKRGTPFYTNINLQKKQRRPEYPLQFNLPRLPFTPEKETPSNTPEKETPSNPFDLYNTRHNISKRNTLSFRPIKIEKMRKQDITVFKADVHNLPLSVNPPRPFKKIKNDPGLDISNQPRVRDLGSSKNDKSFGLLYNHKSNTYIKGFSLKTFRAYVNTTMKETARLNEKQKKATTFKKARRKAIAFIKKLNKMPGVVSVDQKSAETGNKKVNTRWTEWFSENVTNKFKNPGVFKKEVKEPLVIPGITYPSINTLFTTPLPLPSTLYLNPPAANNPVEQKKTGFRKYVREHFQVRAFIDIAFKNKRIDRASSSFKYTVVWNLTHKTGSADNPIAFRSYWADHTEYFSDFRRPISSIEKTERPGSGEAGNDSSDEETTWLQNLVNNLFLLFKQQTTTLKDWADDPENLSLGADYSYEEGHGIRVTIKPFPETFRQIRNVFARGGRRMVTVAKTAGQTIVQDAEEEKKEVIDKTKTILKGSWLFFKQQTTNLKDWGSDPENLSFWADFSSQEGHGTRVSLKPFPNTFRKIKSKVVRVGKEKGNDFIKWCSDPNNFSLGFNFDLLGGEPPQTYVSIRPFPKTFKATRDRVVKYGDEKIKDLDDWAKDPRNIKLSGEHYPQDASVGGKNKVMIKLFPQTTTKIAGAAVKTVKKTKRAGDKVGRGITAVYNRVDNFLERCVSRVEGWYNRTEHLEFYWKANVINSGLQSRRFTILINPVKLYLQTLLPHLSPNTDDEITDDEINEIPEPVKEIVRNPHVKKVKTYYAPPKTISLSGKRKGVICFNYNYPKTVPGLLRKFNEKKKEKKYKYYKTQEGLRLKNSPLYYHLNKRHPEFFFRHLDCIDELEHPFRYLTVEIHNTNPIRDKYVHIKSRVRKMHFYRNLYRKPLDYFLMIHPTFDLFYQNQPTFQNLTVGEEKRLFEKRLVLGKYYESFRDYKFLPYLEEFHQYFSNSKGNADKVFNHQFKGLYDVVKRSFAITERATLGKKSFPVLKFDQPLYRDPASYKNLKPFHEELVQKKNDNNIGLEISNPIPFYAGWDPELRKLVLTNRLLPRSRAGYRLYPPKEKDDRSENKVKYSTKSKRAQKKIIAKGGKKGERLAENKVKYSTKSKRAQKKIIAKGGKKGERLASFIDLKRNIKFTSWPIQRYVLREGRYTDNYTEYKNIPCKVLSEPRHAKNNRDYNFENFLDTKRDVHLAMNLGLRRYLNKVFRNALPEPVKKYQYQTCNVKALEEFDIPDSLLDKTLLFLRKKQNVFLKRHTTRFRPSNYTLTGLKERVIGKSGVKQELSKEMKTLRVKQKKIIRRNRFYRHKLRPHLIFFKNLREWIKFYSMLDTSKATKVWPGKPERVVRTLLKKKPKVSEVVFEEGDNSPAISYLEDYEDEKYI